MKVGIFNRWLPTYGGGERHSLAIASHLARDHCVEYISHVPLETSQVSPRVDLNLDRVRFRAVPTRPPAQLGQLATDYDLFINASHGDFVPPLARRNAMLVFFPAPPQNHIPQRARRYVAHLARQFGMQIRSVNGVYGRERVAGVDCHGLARRSQFVLPASTFRPLRLHLSLASVSPATTGAAIDLDGDPLLSVDLVCNGGYAPATVTVPPGRDRVLSISAVGDLPKRDICLRMVPIRIASARASLYDFAFHERWPEAGARLSNILPADLVGISERYDLLWANSEYTQRWIHAYWGLPSTVLYPPIHVERYAPGSKRSRILSVGRFFAGNHNKKHVVMIEAFRHLLEEGLTDWELHLAGSVTPGQRHLEYVSEVRRAAQGLPIHIHTDLPQSKLLELYATSAIYWHAAGHGESPTRQPEKFEHFGISAVEAMATGCAPVVVGQGGLTELVHHERDGYLWYTTGELQTYTKQLIKDAALRSRIAQAAIVSSRRFAEVSFESRLQNTLAPLLEQ